MLKFLVAGTGRCGTVFMSKWLTSVGVPCGHEAIFNLANQELILSRLSGETMPTRSQCSMREDRDLLPNYKRQELLADATYMAVPYLDWPEVKKLSLIHVVRHPLKVVSSFVLDLNYFKQQHNNKFNVDGWEQWIYKQCPELLDVKNPIERGCLYYILWNRKIEQARRNQPYIFHRIESEFSPMMYAFLGVKRPPKEQEYQNYRSNSFRLQGGHRLEMGDIPDGEIKRDLREIMDDYNYTFAKYL